MNPHQRWTQSAITELRERVQLGETLADIVTALERQPGDVSAMMGRLRLRFAAMPESAFTR